MTRWGKKASGPHNKGDLDKKGRFLSDFQVFCAKMGGGGIVTNHHRKKREGFAGQGREKQQYFRTMSIHFFQAASCEEKENLPTCNMGKKKGKGSSSEWSQQHDQIYLLIGAGQKEFLNGNGAKKLEKALTPEFTID